MSCQIILLLSGLFFIGAIFFSKDADKKYDEAIKSLQDCHDILNKAKAYYDRSSM